MKEEIIKRREGVVFSPSDVPYDSVQIGRAHV